MSNLHNIFYQLVNSGYEKSNDTGTSYLTVATVLKSRQVSSNGYYNN